MNNSSKCSTAPRSPLHSQISLLISKKYGIDDIQTVELRAKGEHCVHIFDAARDRNGNSTTSSCAMGFVNRDHLTCQDASLGVAE